VFNIPCASQRAAAIFFGARWLAETPTEGNMKTLAERIKVLQEHRSEHFAEAEAQLSVLAAEGRDPTAEEQARLTELVGEDGTGGLVAELTKQIEREQNIAAVAKQIVAGRSATIPSANQELKPERMPAKARRQNTKHYESSEDAYEAGQFILATIGGSRSAQQWCRDRGVVATHTTFDNPKGGYTVPETLESAIIRLVEERGVFRRNSRSYPIPGGSVLLPRRASGFTAYFTAETQAITESTASFDQIKLEAKKLAVLTAISSELDEDSVAALADFVTLEFALAFADKEDRCGFNGDGSATFGGITGLKSALLAGSTHTAANKSFGALVIGEFLSMMGKLPEFPGIQPRWYASKAAWAASMARLQIAAGGNNVADIGSGPQVQFLGYPVEFVQVMNSTLTDQANEVGTVYFGDLGMASTFGTKREITIRSDESKYFAEDMTAVRATERFDIVVHETGTATDPGPIVGLKFSA
jgi:HK97 family phage major capsid protein